MHPATKDLMRWFDSSHLPAGSYAKEVFQECAALAQALAHSMPDDPEKTVGLRKLMEAKDCFVRAAVRATENEAK